MNYIQAMKAITYCRCCKGYFEVYDTCKYFPTCVAESWCPDCMLVAQPLNRRPETFPPDRIAFLYQCRCCCYWVAAQLQPAGYARRVCMACCSLARERERAHHRHPSKDGV